MSPEQGEGGKDRSMERPVLGLRLSDKVRDMLLAFLAGVIVGLLIG